MNVIAGERQLIEVIQSLVRMVQSSTYDTDPDLAMKVIKSASVQLSLVYSMLRIHANAGHTDDDTEFQLDDLFWELSSLHVDCEYPLEQISQMAHGYAEALHGVRNYNPFKVTSMLRAIIEVKERDYEEPSQLSPLFARVLRTINPDAVDCSLDNIRILHSVISDIELESENWQNAKEDDEDFYQYLTHLHDWLSDLIDDRLMSTSEAMEFLLHYDNFYAPRDLRVMAAMVRSLPDQDKRRYTRAILTPIVDSTYDRVDLVELRDVLTADTEVSLPLPIICSMTMHNHGKERLFSSANALGNIHSLEAISY
jgi:hypothetical protein